MSETKEKIQKLIEDAQKLTAENKYTVAAQALIQARQKWDEEHGLDLLSQILQRLAHLFQLTFEFQKAISALNSLYELEKERSNSLACAQIKGNIGLLHTRINRYEEAANYFQQATEKFKALGDPKNMALQTGNIGSTHRERKEFTESLDYYFEAAAIFRTLNEDLALADQYSNIAYSFSMLKQYHEAMDYFSKTIPLYEKVSENQKADLARQNIASIEKMMDQ